MANNRAREAFEAGFKVALKLAEGLTLVDKVDVDDACRSEYHAWLRLHPGVKKLDDGTKWQRKMDDANWPDEGIEFKSTVQLPLPDYGKNAKKDVPKDADLTQAKSGTKYKSQITPLCPTAIKLGQTEVHAPEHETWDVVTCNSCTDKFAFGPNQIFGSRISKDEATKELRSRLADDHRYQRAHQNSYEIQD